MIKMVVRRGKSAKQKMFEGVKVLAEAVGSTLGPGGRNVAIDMVTSSRVTKDGVSVAKLVNLADRIMQQGIMTVREAASKTADRAGDGTTTSTVLAEKMIELGMDYFYSMNWWQKILSFFGLYKKHVAVHLGS